MKQSQAQLGHANVQITADVYTHVDEAQRRKAAEALERAFSEICEHLQGNRFGV
jgi:integrase